MSPKMAPNGRQWSEMFMSGFGLKWPPNEPKCLKWLASWVTWTWLAPDKLHVSCIFFRILSAYSLHILAHIGVLTHITPLDYGWERVCALCSGSRMCPEIVRLPESFSLWDVHPLENDVKPGRPNNKKWQQTVAFVATNSLINESCPINGVFFSEWKHPQAAQFWDGFRRAGWAGGPPSPAAAGSSKGAWYQISLQNCARNWLNPTIYNQREGSLWEIGDVFAGCRWQLQSRQKLRDTKIMQNHPDFPMYPPP